MEKKVLPRGAGVLLSITSLPSAYGIGTLGNAALRFIDLLVDMKQSYWQMLPVGPTSFGDSPYQSESAFAGNPYLIDLDGLVADGLLLESEIKSFNWGSSDSNIDYSKMYENRWKVLKIAFERFDTSDVAFHQFLEDKAFWIEDYALYAALKKHFGDVSWLDWEPGCRTCDPKTLDQYRVKLKREIDFYQFTQYEFFKQWNTLKEYATSRGVALIGDLPLYIALDSADVWSHRELFQLKKDGTPVGVAGTPADVLHNPGQIWGEPIYDWNYMEEDDFSWWKKRAEECHKLFDVIRLNHFVGIVKYYMIPFGTEKLESGKWYKGPGKKLTDAITSVIGDAKIIVDDIGPGNVVPGVKKLMTKIGWPGIRVLMYAFEDNTANEHLPHNYENSNLVLYPGTHDSETIVGHFYDKTDYELAYLYEYLNIKNKDEISDALVRCAYASVADVVIIQMQDLLKLGNEARMNAPATVGHNWQWRVGSMNVDEERRAWIRTLASVYRR